MRQGLGGVEYDEDEVASARRRDDLPSASLPLGRALYDARQIEDLYPSSLV